MTDPTSTDSNAEAQSGEAPVSNSAAKEIVVTVELSAEAKAEVEKIKAEFESRIAEVQGQILEKDKALEAARADVELLQTKLNSSEEYADCDALKKENDELKSAQVVGPSRPKDFQAAIKTICGEIKGSARHLAEQFYNFGHSDGSGQ